MSMTEWCLVIPNPSNGYKTRGRVHRLSYKSPFFLFNFLNLEYEKWLYFTSKVGYREKSVHIIKRPDKKDSVEWVFTVPSLVVL
jgi:hypothetical protein